MDVREKLVELLNKANSACVGTDCFEGCKFYMENDCLYKLMADVMIENGVTVQEWIPVGDSPKERGVYIVTVKHWFDGKPVTREAKWNCADWLSCYKAEEITPRVTHWQPMPQPPKGE